MSDVADSHAKPRSSLAAWLGVLAFTVLGILAFVVRLRPVVAALSTATHLIILFAFAAMLLADRSRRPFWIGFVVFSLGYTYLLGGVMQREFYAVPGVLAEWAAGPRDLYFDWSRYDYIPYRVGGKSPYDDPLRSATRDRVRYIAQCLTAVYLGLLGGYFGQRMALRTARREEHPPHD